MIQANNTSRVLKALTAALSIAAASLVAHNANAQSCPSIDDETTCNSTSGCEWDTSANDCVAAGSQGGGGSGDPGECGDNGACGTPNDNGGGCGCGCGGSILVNYTDTGETYSQSDDSDGDGVNDLEDDCVYTPNANQSDVDGDGVGDVCDDCVDTSDKLQAQNPCGDVWAPSDQGFATAAGINNNVGQVIGEVCDEMCATDNTKSQPTNTVGLTPPSTVTGGSGSGASASHNTGGCAAAGVGTGDSAPVGLMLACVGAVAVGVGRRRIAARRRRACV
jgi:hypothetical protein